MLWGKKEQGPSGYQDYCRDFNNPTSHGHMLDLRWLGICLSLKMGGELIQQVSLHKGFPFILLKPPAPLLPETMLWTRWTAGGASTSLGISPPLPPLFLYSRSKFFKTPRDGHHKARNSISASSQILWGFTWQVLVATLPPMLALAMPRVLEPYSRYPWSQQPESAPQLIIIHPEMLASREQQC